MACQSHRWFHNVNRRDGGYIVISGRPYEILVCVGCSQKGYRRDGSGIIYTFRASEVR